MARQSDDRGDRRSAGSVLTRPFRQTAADIRDPNRPAWKRAGTAFAVLFTLFSLIPLVVVAYALLLIPTAPTAAELQRQTQAYPALVLAADGTEIAQLEAQNRVRVPLDSVAQSFIDALLTVEDRRFFEHEGVDWYRTARAVTRTVRGRTEGGSTITQQLARNLYPDQVGRETSIRRKLKEIITARRIERTHTKEEILEEYVNSVPFLYNAFGVEMAARTYFGKRASDLTTEESATLVGMLRGTAYYNPVRNPDRSKTRRNLVLMMMAERGIIPVAESDSLREQPLDLDFEPQEGPPSDYPHFTRFVRRWLSEWADRSAHDLYSDGLVIHTTLDINLQQAAETAVRSRGEQLHNAARAEWSDGSGSPFGLFFSRHPEAETRGLRRTDYFQERLARGYDEETLLDSIRTDTALRDSLREQIARLEVGFVAMHPQTGHIKAWVGSRDHSVTPFDHVWQARRQPGSVFKPFVYAAALERGFLPGDTFIDEQVTIDIGYGRTWRPRNAGDSYAGRPMTLTEGLAYSKNTVTAQLMMEVGPSYVASLARDMGVRESSLEANPALALGTSEVTLLEAVTAFSTIASAGQYNPPVPVTRIETRDGRLVAEFGTESERALSADAAQVLTHMMRGVIDRGTGRRIRGEFGVTQDVIGKTGTSQDGADGWFVMAHPELVMGAWVGFPDPSLTFRTSTFGQGSRNALPVVGEFFRSAQGHIPDARFETPSRYREPGSIWERARSWWDEWRARDAEEFDLEDEDFFLEDLDEDEILEWDPDFDPLEDLDDPAENGAEPVEDLDAFTPEEVDDAAADEPAPDPADDDRTAVQRLYDETGEDLEADLEEDDPNG